MDLPYKKIVLPNKTRLLLIPNPGVNSIATSVMVGVGSRHETQPINGISHFLEHMVFKGTTKYPTTDDVNIVERMGGLQNAYTDIDITNYHNKVLSEDWELGLDVNRELALHPKLESEHVDKERDVIIEEMKRYEDEPSAKAEEVFHTMLYPKTKLGMRTIGEAETLKNVGAAELRAYHDAWYTPDGMTIVLSGNVGPYESRIIERVNEWFLGLKAADTHDPVETVTDKQDAPVVMVTTKPDANQAHFVLGLRTFARKHEDRFAWSVFNLLMGVSFTSRLFREIREKRGLCYHIRSSNSSYADVGNWSIYAGVATDKVQEAVKAVMEQLARVKESGVTEEEVAVAKKRLKTILAFKSEDPEFLAEYYGRQEVYGEEIMTLDEYLRQSDTVTPDQIHSLIKKYFVTKHLNLSLVWNTKSGSELVKELTI